MNTVQQSLRAIDYKKNGGASQTTILPPRLPSLRE